MNIHALYDQIFRIWRRRRMERFVALVAPQADEVILDVGGMPGTWINREPLGREVICVNVNAVEWDGAAFPAHHIEMRQGDGCELPHADGSFAVLFSNSVIEHVGDWAAQQAFAQEARRVGRRLWIQTPAFECPLEPHFLAPVVHWLPVSIRRRVVRWVTLWGWITKPTQAEVDRMIAGTRLLTRRDMAQLFPDCVILTERLLGVLPKSYVAYRV
ncbi:methyltransferase domain-containing protein [Actomonas aquatica]|uniref:Methyltransferase domain-containing protein n=1 Tax=Actomonas aquatica TaxID=2866162 RepID=A0ABZ1C5K7_9BACT|nr:methyltransferase domain-containing protein [Opitutus sp. WL0086]WRQ86687.1 methyltransferase domain-containing protein [Opitutus sp. WL0086]